MCGGEFPNLRLWKFGKPGLFMAPGPDSFGLLLPLLGCPVACGHPSGPLKVRSTQKRIPPGRALAGVLFGVGTVFACGGGVGDGRARLSHVPPNLGAENNAKGQGEPEPRSCRR